MDRWNWWYIATKIYSICLINQGASSAVYLVYCTTNRNVEMAIQCLSISETIHSLNKHVFSVGLCGCGIGPCLALQTPKMLSWCKQVTPFPLASRNTISCERWIVFAIDCLALMNFLPFHYLNYLNCSLPCVYTHWCTYDGQILVFKVKSTHVRENVFGELCWQTVLDSSLERRGSRFLMCIFYFE